MTLFRPIDKLTIIGPSGGEGGSTNRPVDSENFQFPEGVWDINLIWSIDKIWNIGV